ncbi:MAG: enoyl-CoA hydratase/isomerase family protein [Chloroflexi bacterium]|nr:enoyl-CoA hydratase/isomerase family protein [Chloroflexota bacterium]
MSIAQLQTQLGASREVVEHIVASLQQVGLVNVIREGIFATARGKSTLEWLGLMPEARPVSAAVSVGYWSQVAANVTGGIGQLILNRPERMNAMTNQMLADMDQALRSLAGREDVRVIVVRGAGDRAFCAGRDLKEVEQLQWTKDVSDVILMAELIEVLTVSSKPTIAAVKGYVRGWGNWLAASCDIVVACEDATFALPQINFGDFEMVPMVPIMRRIGRGKVLDMLLTADVVGASEAKEIGLVDRLLPVEGFWGAVGELAQKIADCDPQAVRAGKEALWLLTDFEVWKSLRMMTNATLLQRAGWEPEATKTREQRWMGTSAH